MVSVDGQRVAAAGARQLGARDSWPLVVLGHQHARDVDLAAADVGVQVDAAGHDDAAVQRILLIDLRFGGGRDDAAVRDVDVAHLAVDAVRGIVDFAAGELDQHS